MGHPEVGVIVKEQFIGKKIVVVDDDPAIVNLVQFILNKEGFEVFTASDGNTGFSKIRNILPDLVILDLHMPGMSGFEICTRLRSDFRFSHMPILVLTGSTKIENGIALLNFSADDYIIKPFTRRELVARTNALLRRAHTLIDLNPLTRLPGNASVSAKLSNLIETGSDFCVLYVDIKKLKAFNEHYGFVRGNDVIKMLTQILIQTVHDKGEPDNFIGHTDDDNFVIITSPEHASSVSLGIIWEFDQKVKGLYDAEDLRQGYIVNKNRQGKEEKFPITSIAIGIVSTKKREITHPGQIAQIGNELVSYAKTFDDSKLIIDRRKDQQAPSEPAV